MNISKEQIRELVKRALNEINNKGQVEIKEGGIPVGISNRHI